MSHFSVGIIIPKGDEEKAEETVEKLLAPFDENLEVPEYQRDCGCIGSVAWREARKQLEAELGSFDDVRSKYRELPKAEQTDKKWKELTAPYFTREEELRTKHPLIKQPDKDCEECKGTGKHASTYNPQSQWDWYSIGGRWDGDIQGTSEERRDKKDGGFNFGSEHHQLQHNAVNSSKVRADWTPFALLTPKGEWIERGKMGWWGMVSDEQDEAIWSSTVKKVLKKYPEHLIVQVDCHI